MSEHSQRADYVFNFILLKQADARNASRSRLQTRCGVFHGDATKGKNGDIRLASFPQGGKAGRRRCGCTSFSEYRSEDNEVGFLRLGAQDISDGVAGGGNEKMVLGQWAVGRELHNRARLPGQQIVCAEMDSIGSRSQRDIGARVN